MLQPGSKFDKYTIEAQLGVGGMGMVYRATNPFGVPVVLKMLHPQFTGDAAVVERFRREGRIQYTLKHPNIVRVTDIVEQDGIPALVVDYMSGEDLEQRLGRKGPLPVDDTIRISTALLDALELAHENGFIHRDLKPANVFLEADGKGGFEPRLMDFGIAKIEEAGALTRTNEFAGTPAYASPEQIASTKDVDHATDIYSFGAVMWSMCTGEEPYRDLSADPYAVLAKVVESGLPPLPSSAPDWLRRIVEKATRRHPRDRYPSAAAFRDALVAAAAASDRFANSVANFSPIAGDGGWASHVPGMALEDTFSDIDLPSGDRRPEDRTADELAAAAFGPLNPRAREGLERLRREQGSSNSGRSWSRAGGLSLPYRPGAVPGAATSAGRIISNSEAIRQAAEKLHAQSGPPASAPRPRPVADAAPAPRTEELDRARVRAIERSFDPGAKRRRARWKLGLALGGVTLVAAAAAAAWWVVENAPQQAPPGFVRVEPGTFTMGSPPDEPGRTDEERAHQVTIARPFAIQVTEVTRGAWTDLMYSEPTGFPGCGDNCPVTNVTWIDAVRYANRLSVREDLQPCYDVQGNEVRWPRGLECEGYRLPTEAEWEYAARAGATTAFANGALRNHGRELLDPHLAVVGWYGANSDVTYAGADCSTWGPDRTTCGPKPVGTRRANAWGLFDMHGNVAEWVWDRHAAYAPEAVVDPTGAESGSQRVVRGGSWRDVSERCRSAARDRTVSVDRDYIGFRLARTLR